MLSNVRTTFDTRCGRWAQPGLCGGGDRPNRARHRAQYRAFSLLNSVAWRPLPVPDPDALVSIYQDFRGAPRRTVYGARSLFSLPEYRAYRDETQTLSGVMAYSRSWTVTLGANPRRTSTASSSRVTTSTC